MTTYYLETQGERDSALQELAENHPRFTVDEIREVLILSGWEARRARRACEAADEFNLPLAEAAKRGGLGGITVADLIAALSKLDPSLLVVQQDDAEGNGYRLARGIDEANYVPANTWRGEVYQDEDLPHGLPAVKCCVIHPIN